MGFIKIVNNIYVPTGNILIIEGSKGYLECLSIGDYGKEKNIKADFLGLSDEIEGVPNGDILPLSEKWVITISSQYGCSIGCDFCDVPKVGRGRNATYQDLQDQITESLRLHPEIKSTKRLNIHFARMGEPTFNYNVIKLSYDLNKIIEPYLGESLIHPVVSTMMPKNNKYLRGFLYEWATLIKNEMQEGEAGLQISVNSTDTDQRKKMFNNNALSLTEISGIFNSLADPMGRKYTLNFALADNYIVDAILLKKLFAPKKFICKITPMHLTNSCKENGILTKDGYDNYYPYKKVESELKNEGFDVIVFIPSKDEDLSGITCGNAILSKHK